jgi:hypothetical protein
MQGIVTSWAQQIRDSEFLVEMRLKNLEHHEPKSVESPINPSPAESTSSLATNQTDAHE